LKKIQQFYILKIESGRLKEAKFKIKNLTLDQARLNGEVVSLSNSQMIRTIQKLTNKAFSQFDLDKLLDEKRVLTKKKNSNENRDSLKELNKMIDEILYIPQIISIFFEDKRHFYNILDRDGFYVNGIRYVPFLASAGMIRRDTYLFIDSSLKEEIAEIFNNGRNQDVEINPSKFSAYYSLFSSSTIPVSFPKIAVVPDMIIKQVRVVDFSTYMGVGIDPKIEEVEREIEVNAFDGEGLCSPKLAKKWAKELDMDYIPAVIGVRAPYLKGMVAVFDFHEFAEKVAKKKTFTDIYGETVSIDSVDCIISESMFKLWSAYGKTSDYVNKCVENDLGWGITKVNAKKEKNHAKTSYQFLQVLSLNDEQIERLCKPTLDWLAFVSGKDINHSLLYSLGETSFCDGWFDRLDPVYQTLILENSFANDSYFISHIDKSIAKKKNDAKIGRLIFNGNYQVMVSDPYAMAAHVLGMGLVPLLQEHQHYSKYWNDRNKTQVASIRSPIVHSSEVNVLNLQNNDDVNYWYQYIYSGIIFNCVGMDSAIQGGSDFDLDLVCTLDSPEIIEGRVPGLPILYDNKKASKIKINKDSERAVIESQANQIKTNKIGFLTNVSSAFYSLLYNFKAGSPEHTAILNRQKFGRVGQGLEIDKLKGIICDPFPDHFVKWQKIKDDMTDDEKKYHEFNNSIVANHRPYFMRWLYSHFNRKYLRELEYYENVSQTRWELSFEELRSLENKTEEQLALVDRYNRKSFFIDSDSVMNRITKYIEKRLVEIRSERLEESSHFDYSVLLSKDFDEPIRRDIEKMRLLFKEYKSWKRSLRENYTEFGNNFASAEQLISYINKKAYSTISSDSSELANIAVHCSYKLFGKNSKSFCFSVFGKEIVQNIRSKKTEKFVRVPMPSPTGNIEYLWERYGMFLLNVEDKS
jgi:hypothetical protein